MEEGLRKDNKVWTLLQYYDTMVLYKKRMETKIMKQQLLHITTQLEQFVELPIIRKKVKEED